MRSLLPSVCQFSLFFLSHTKINIAKNTKKMRKEKGKRKVNAWVNLGYLQKCRLFFKNILDFFGVKIQKCRLFRKTYKNVDFFCTKMSTIKKYKNVDLFIQKCRLFLTKMSTYSKVDIFVLVYHC